MVLGLDQKYALKISDSLEVYACLSDIRKMIVNFDDCLTKENRLPAGTTWFNVSDTIKPCTTKDLGNGITSITHDGLFRVNGFGGYALGHGCFYTEI